MNMDQQNPQNYPKRYVPSTDTEFQKDVTRPSYADKQQLQQLDNRVSRRYIYKDANGNVQTNEDGNPISVRESLLDLYEMFTQDLRLGNLTEEEIDFCREYIDLAYDLLHCGFPQSSTVVFERAIGVVETSHSKKGWFREKLGTIRSELTQEYYEPKKSLWTGKKEGR